jgi:hypothetical protein
MMHVLVHSLLDRRVVMAKGQKNSGREAKKPKAAKKAPTAPVSDFSEPLPVKKKPRAV